jgi:hypothetical protein
LTQLRAFALARPHKLCYNVRIVYRANVHWDDIRQIPFPDSNFDAGRKSRTITPMKMEFGSFTPGNDWK